MNVEEEKKDSTTKQQRHHIKISLLMAHLGHALNNMLEITINDGQETIHTHIHDVPMACKRTDSTRHGRRCQEKKETLLQHASTVFLAYCRWYVSLLCHFCCRPTKTLYSFICFIIFFECKQ